jgi:pimeloyl-ACP methyl ester carboxylesterase
LNLYFISGLAVDKRVFKKLTLSTNFSIHYIEWIRPFIRESVSNYAKRLSASIDQTQPFGLVGLSFGGMIAIEMNQFVHPVKTIIISSAATKTELPWFIRLIRFMPLYKLIPSRLMKSPNQIFFRLFGIKTKDEKELLKAILKDTDSNILSWSIHAIINWRNEVIPPNFIHIHGNADNILPIKFTKPDIIIEGGHHFMIYSKANEISLALNDLLAQAQL